MSTQRMNCTEILPVLMNISYQLCISYDLFHQRSSTLSTAVFCCLLLFVVVCCCLLLFVVVCCCLLLFVVVCCCLLLFVVVCCCLLLFVVVCCLLFVVVCCCLLLVVVGCCLLLLLLLLLFVSRYMHTSLMGVVLTSPYIPTSTLWLKE